MQRPTAILCLAIVLLGSGCPLFYDLDSAMLAGGGDAGTSPSDVGTDMQAPRDVGGSDARLVDMTRVDMMTMDMSSDAASTDMRNDSGFDAGGLDAGRMDVGVDMPVDMGSDTFGQTCPNPQTLSGACNLVDQNCPADQICEVVLTMNGPLSGCSARDSNATYLIAEGEACEPVSSDKCEPGLRCRVGSCVKYCDLADARGCAPDQFCAPFDAANLPGVGYCADSC